MSSSSSGQQQQEKGAGDGPPPKRTLSALLKKTVQSNAAAATNTATADAAAGSKQVSSFSMGSTPSAIVIGACTSRQAVGSLSTATTTAMSKAAQQGGGGVPASKNCDTNIPGPSLDDYARAIATLTTQAKSVKSGLPIAGRPQVSIAEAAAAATAAASGRTQKAPLLPAENRSGLSALAMQTLVCYRQSNSQVNKPWFQSWLVRTYNVPASVIIEMSHVIRVEGYNIVHVLLNSVDTHNRMLKQFYSQNKQLQLQCIIRPAAEVVFDGALVASSSGCGDGHGKANSFQREPQAKRMKTITATNKPTKEQNEAQIKSLDDCWEPLLLPLVEKMKAMIGPSQPVSTFQQQMGNRGMLNQVPINAGSSPANPFALATFHNAVMAQQQITLAMATSAAKAWASIMNGSGMNMSTAAGFGQSTDVGDGGPSKPSSHSSSSSASPSNTGGSNTAMLLQQIDKVVKEQQEQHQRQDGGLRQ